MTTDDRTAIIAELKGLRGEVLARLDGHDREIRDLKTAFRDSRNNRAPWPMIGSFVVAALALLVVLVPLVAK